MLLGGIFLALLASATAQDFTSPLDFNGVITSFATNGSCNTRGASLLCRQLPWIPRTHEGVVEKESAAFVIMDTDLPADSQIARWSKKFSAETRAEMVSYFMINNPSFAQAVATSPYTVVYLLMVKDVGGVYKIQSVSMNIASQLTSEVANQYNVVQGEIEGTRGEWIPSLKFKMGHQFKLNDAI